MNELARYARMTVCESCDTAILIEDDVVRAAGVKGIMHDTVSLFDIGDTVKTGGQAITLRGKARFSYGRGFWDEFWGLDEQSASVWVSLDEGDVAIQRELDNAGLSDAVQQARIGDSINIGDDEYIITEIEQAECIALRGVFDHALKVGETYSFFNASGLGSAILSYEYWDGGAQLYLGNWFNPFDIAVEPAS